LSAAIDADAARIYAAQGVRFEQRWYGVMNHLSVAGQSSVSQLASAMSISHASVSETRASLERMGLVVSEPDPGDARRRLLRLSPTGEAFVERLSSLWATLEAVSHDLDVEAEGVAAALDRLERALTRKTVYQRVAERLGRGPSKAPTIES